MLKKLLLITTAGAGAYYLYRKVAKRKAAKELLKNFEEVLENTLENIEMTREIIEEAKELNEQIEELEKEETTERKLPKYKKEIINNGEKVATLYSNSPEFIDVIEYDDIPKTTKEAEELIKEFKATLESPADEE